MITEVLRKIVVLVNFIQSIILFTLKYSKHGSFIFNTAGKNFYGKI